MKALDKVEAALRAAQTKGITIQAGSAAFYWRSDKNVPLTCSGTGALILFYELRDYTNLTKGIARPGWLKALIDNLGVTGWWFRRFHCGFELGRVVYVPTTNKTKMWFVDAKGKKHYYKEDTVSLAAIKLMKRYSR